MSHFLPANLALLFGKTVGPKLIEINFKKVLIAKKSFEIICSYLFVFHRE